jgi:hypothetical protein
MGGGIYLSNLYKNALRKRDLEMGGGISLSNLYKNALRERD